MKVLMVALRAPQLPLRNGYDVHLYYLLRELARLHDVYVFIPPGRPPPPDIGVTWYPDDGESGDRSSKIQGGLASIARRQATAMAPGLGEAVRQIQPDVAHIASDRLAPLGSELSDVPAVLGAIDAAHLNAKADMRNAGPALPRHLARYLVTRQLVRSVYPSFASVTVVSNEDATALQSLVPNLSLRVIPNGVDAAEYAPRSGVERDESQLLFTGALDYPPNVHAAELLAQEILPRVRESVPDAQLRLVGRNPSPTVTALEDHPGVEVIPNVPDMVPYLSEATVFVCPMTSGTGIKNKLLEAMANELPCATTPLALRGIEANPGSDVLVGSDVDQLSAAAVRLLGDPALRSQLGIAGRALVQRDHSWQSVAEKYTDLYEEIT